MYSQKRLSQASILIPTKYFQNRIIMFCLELWYCVEKYHTTVKDSNFVTLLDENIFFLQTFLSTPHDFFWYWNLYRWDLGFVQSNFGPIHCLGLKNSFFCGVTKLGDHHLISSPSKVFKVTMTTLNTGCSCHHCFCDGKILYILQMTPCKGL
jgi:hypothetical protein